MQVAEDALSALRNRRPEHQRHNSRVPFAIYYNYLHAIELGLKAYMLHAGLGIKELRKVGHDLTKALQICVENGLRDHCPGLTDMLIAQIELGSETYRAKQFEYVQIGALTLPHVDQVAIAANTLLAGIDAIEMDVVAGRRGDNSL